jgi:hypothetical protein
LAGTPTHGFGIEANVDGNRCMTAPVDFGYFAPAGQVPNPVSHNT